MNVKAYLERISYVKPTASTYEELCNLVYCHVMSVPFENIDVQNKVPIILGKESIYKKVVNNQRGGYCYELNSLFYELLKGLGFDVYMIMARVVSGNNIGPEYDHLALIVTIDNKKYLVDVGFGDFSLKPLLIDEVGIQYDGRHEYRISEHGVIEGEHYMKVEKKNTIKDEYHVNYYFSIKERELNDFSEMNKYQQTHPDSHFVRNFICSKPTPNGRISILNYKAVFTYKKTKRSKIINERQRAEIISKYFGINFYAGAIKNVHSDIGS